MIKKDQGTWIFGETSMLGEKLVPRDPRWITVRIMACCAFSLQCIINPQVRWVKCDSTNSFVKVHVWYSMEVHERRGNRSAKSASAEYTSDGTFCWRPVVWQVDSFIRLNWKRRRLGNSAYYRVFSCATVERAIRIRKRIPKCYKIFNRFSNVSSWRMRVKSFFLLGIALCRYNTATFP